MVVPKRFKNVCVACGTADPKINKEHFWPEWLIQRTGTHKTSVLLRADKRVNPRSFVVPLCVTCNTDFGRELEAPVAQIFSDIENGRGISDVEAEVLIRWLWKFEGLIWSFRNPERIYNEKYTLRQRVLTPVDEFRSNLALAISLIAVIESKFGDAPMGIDSWTDISAVFVAGVFSRTALMVLEQQFEALIPEQFAIYRLGVPKGKDRCAKLFYPSTGFRNCVEAVNVTRDVALFLSHAHDLEARNRAVNII